MLFATMFSGTGTQGLSKCKKRILSLGLAAGYWIALEAPALLAALA